MIQAGHHMAHVILWWFILQGLGLIALPITFRLLRWLPDRGYALAKPTGLLLVSYALWLGASTGFLRNDLAGILAAVLLAGGLSVWVYFRRKATDLSLTSFLRRNLRLVLTYELLFTLAFVAWAVLRAYAPNKIMPAGGEKWMEIAFLNGILNSPSFPPLDPWLSGFAISYYYFGYVMMALLTRLSGAASTVGFELYDALLFALTVTGAFGLVYNLVAGSRGERSQGGPAAQSLNYGLLGALLVAVMGNLEGMLEAVRSRGLLPQSFWTWLDIPDLANSPVSGTWFPQSSFFWSHWWRASRVIQDRDLINRPLGISPITEFPVFSFLLGDNHPHVLALPFALLCAALALNLLRRQMTIRTAEAELEGRPAFGWNPLAALDGDWALFLFYALSIGALGFLNTWDMPIYLGLATLAYGLGEYSFHRRLDWPLVQRTLALALGLLLTALTLYIFFYLGFGSQASGVVPYLLPPTRLPQYLVIFGVFIFILIPFLVVSRSAQSRQAGRWETLRPVFKTWGWVVLACLGAFVLVLVAASLSEVGRQIIQGTVSDPALQAALGGLGLLDALRAVFATRLLNPWLFLLLSGLIATALTAAASWGAPTATAASDERLAADLGPDCASSSHLFAILLSFAGLALTLSVEFFYLRDTFGARMNTVFKFYYQGWVMLGAASAYAVWWLLNPGRRFLSSPARSVFAGGTTLLIALGLVYPLMAGYTRANGFRGPADLDGASEVARDNPDDWAAIQWLRANALTGDGEDGIPILLEAPGRNYDYQARISAFTGLPALLGWANHEAQWRGTYTEQGLREPDIQTIYTSPDGEQSVELLHRWAVDYVILGVSEKNYIQQVCAERGCNLGRALRKFDATLVPVFQQGEMTIYRVPEPQL